MVRESEMRKRGVTLVEALIGTVLVGIIILTVAALSMSLYRMYGEAAIQSEMNRTVRYAVDRVKRDFRESKGVTDLFNNPGGGGDAVLLTISRRADNTFARNPSTGESVASAIVVYCVYTTGEGTVQLRRYIAYYTPDLTGLTPPFSLGNNPLAGGTITLRDSATPRASFTIDLATGVVNGRQPTIPPEVILNQVTGFDVTLGTPVTVTVSAEKEFEQGHSVPFGLTGVVSPRNP